MKFSLVIGGFKIFYNPFESDWPEMKPKKDQFVKINGYSNEFWGWVSNNFK